jgi:hypothetical protein
MAEKLTGKMVGSDIVRTYVNKMLKESENLWGVVAVQATQKNRPLVLTYPCVSRLFSDKINNTKERFPCIREKRRDEIWN